MNISRWIHVSKRAIYAFVILCLLLPTLGTAPAARAQASLPTVSGSGGYTPGKAGLSAQDYIAEEYQILKLAVAIRSDGSGDMVIERKIHNIDLVYGDRDFWYFNWPGLYSNLRAWDAKGPLQVVSSQSGTELDTIVMFRDPVPPNGTYDFYLGITITGMATYAGSYWDAGWYTYPGSTVAKYGQTVTFPSNAEILSYYPSNGVQTYNIVDWQYTDYPADTWDAIDVQYNLSGTLKPPLVIVHGWLGSPLSTDSDQCAIGIQPYNHGNNTLNIPATTIGSFAGWFDNDYDVWIAHIDTSRDQGTPALMDNGACLARQLERLVDSNSDKITIIAHSMGGLVSRAAIGLVSSRVQIKALYTVGSPHAGEQNTLVDITARLEEPLAPCKKQVALCQFKEDYMKDVFNNNSANANEKGILYNFIGGDGSDGAANDLGKVQMRLAGAPSRKNDAVVGQYSAVGWAYPNQSFLPSSWATVAPGQYYTNEVHTDDYGTSYYSGVSSPDPAAPYSRAYACIRAIMSGSTLHSCQKAPRLIASPQNSSSASDLSSFTDFKTGHVAAGETTSIALPVDGTGPSVFYLSWIGNQPPSFTLTAPSAIAINPEYAAAHPGLVTYSVNTGSDESIPFTAYSFSATESGLWYLNISAVDAIDFVGFAALNSARSLSAQLDRTAYSVGDTAAITAHLLRDTVGLAGHSLAANIFRSDAITDVVSLIDDGNGDYSANYTIPNAPGFLSIEVVASGVDNGISFSRQQDLSATVNLGDLQLSAVYDAQPRDFNGNGFYEALEFTAGVNLVNAGSYVASAVLYAGNKLVARAAGSFDLDAGMQTISLLFDGDEIRNSGIDGPYTITNLSLITAKSGIPAASGENLFTTATYKHDLFGDHTYYALTRISTASSDGWVLESSETSNKGGSINARETIFYLGDDAANKQYRAILSFPIVIPGNAVITSVTLQIKKAGQQGANPFQTMGNITIDIRKGAFSNNAVLQAGDFQAFANKNAALTIPNTPAAGWYSGKLNPINFGYINRSGVTQFRLRFVKDDNNNHFADFLKFYSSNAATAGYRPRLIIAYYVP